MCKTVFHFRWPLLYGRPILATAAACTGFYINLRFRKKLRLRDYGGLPTIVSLTAVPTAMTGLFYSEVQSANKN